MQEYYSYCVILLVFVFPAPFFHAISEHTKKKKRKKNHFFPALNSFVYSSEKKLINFTHFPPILLVKCIKNHCQIRSYSYKHAGYRLKSVTVLCILAWKTLWMDEPGRLPSMG